jgi:hypothetical protein
MEGRTGRSAAPAPSLANNAHLVRARGLGIRDNGSLAARFDKVLEELHVRLPLWCLA